MAEVVFRNVTKRFGDVVAVKDVSLEIKDQEFLVLVGPSGCGKSTTLRMIAGLEEITEGELYIGDQLVNGVAPKERDIAMVFQNYALYPHMNVYENMAFALKLRNMDENEIDARVQQAAELLGISALLERKPKHLSGGQRQRVALGRAIVRKPKVFLMDEPLSNLDAKLRVHMRTELQKLHDRLETTIVYVTHDQTEAMTMGDRIVVLNEGEIQQVDTPLNLYNKPENKFVASFIGSPAMNFIDCKLIKEGEEYRLLAEDGTQFSLNSRGVKSWLREYEDQEVTMGIRPEDIFDAQLVDEASYGKLNRVTSEVEVVEPMGSETYVYINVGGEVITAEVEAETDAAVGQRLEFAFNMDKVHIFAPGTEENLSLE